MDDKKLYYSEPKRGNLVEISIETGVKRVYDFGIKI